MEQGAVTSTKSRKRKLGIYLLVYLGICAFLAVMISSAGVAISPRIANVAAPYICLSKNFVIKTEAYFVPPNKTGYTVQFYCPADKQKVGEMKLFAACTAIYTVKVLIALAVLIVIGVIIARLRKKHRPAHAGRKKRYASPRVLILIIVAIVGGIIAFNVLVFKTIHVQRLHQAVEVSGESISGLLEQRYSNIPKVVDIVRREAAQDDYLALALESARDRFSGATDVKAKAQAALEVETALDRLMTEVKQRYPRIESDADYMMFYINLNLTKEQLPSLIDEYNSAAKEFNDYNNKLINSAINSIIGFEPHIEYLTKPQ